jgi:hypothetical protein
MAGFLNKIGLDSTAKKAIAATLLAGTAIILGFRFIGSGEP